MKCVVAGDEACCVLKMDIFASRFKCKACQDTFMLASTTPNWVAVKELKLSYYIGETLLFTIYTHYGNLI